MTRGAGQAVHLTGPHVYKLNGAQREQIFVLAENRALTSPIKIRQVGRRIHAVDRHGNAIALDHFGNLAIPTPR